MSLNSDYRYTTKTLFKFCEYAHTQAIGLKGIKSTVKI